MLRRNSTRSIHELLTRSVISPWSVGLIFSHKPRFVTVMNRCFVWKKYSRSLRRVSGGTSCWRRKRLRSSIVIRNALSSGDIVATMPQKLAIMLAQTIEPVSMRTHAINCSDVLNDPCVHKEDSGYVLRDTQIEVHV